LAELCQRAAKAAIRDAIAAEELRKQAAENGDDATMAEAVGHEITRKHFEEAFAGARRSVSLTDLGKYDNFRQKFDPSYKTKTGGIETVVINWPDASGAAPAAAAEEDDLYS
jgi:transitional endoplasmic reticulum ATPase